MGAKKRTKPIVPAKKETARRLWTIRWLQHSNIWKVKKDNKPYRFATLWEAATEFITTEEFKKIVKISYKNRSKQFIDDFMNFKDEKSNLYTEENLLTGAPRVKIGNKRQIKFVLNMFRDIKEDLPKKMIPFDMPKPTARDKMIKDLLFQGLGSFIRTGSNKLLKKN